MNSTDPMCPACKQSLNDCTCDQELEVCHKCGFEECVCPEPIDHLNIIVKVTKCTVELSKEAGSQIKDLIQEHYPHTFPHYCSRVGVSPPNFYNVVNGDRPCSLEFLNKLLSGVGFEAKINPEVLIEELDRTEILGRIGEK